MLENINTNQMKYKNRKYILMLLVFFSFFSCVQNNKKPKENRYVITIDSITSFFYNCGINTIEAITCEELANAKMTFNFKKGRAYGVIKAKITDRETLKKIENEISLLKPDTVDYPMDVRIAINIFYSNGDTAQICMNGHSPNILYLNGRQQMTNNRLIFLIKNNIGYYSWIHSNEIELKDTSAAKESIIESPYYKQYLKMVNKKK